MVQKYPYVVNVSISAGGIPKLPIASARVTFSGLEGDGHNHEKHNDPLQAICLQDIEMLKELCEEGFPLTCGTIGENLTVRYLDVQSLSIGTILEFEGGVALELTKVRKPCYVLDAIDPRLKETMIGRCGFYARVIQEGMVKVGEAIYVRQPVMQQDPLLEKV